MCTVDFVCMVSVYFKVIVYDHDITGCTAGSVKMHAK